MKNRSKKAYLSVAANKKAISNVITTVVITGILLIILLVASFVSTNVLTLQINSTEFEQAKTNMILLDSTIQDVALRPNSGGYVQFNERTGGVGTSVESVDVSVLVQSDTGQFEDASVFDESQLEVCSVVYRAGTLTSASAVDLKGNGSLGCAINSSQSIGYARILFDEGAKIGLDYNRMRITQVGLIDGSTNLIEITFIRLIQGTLSGSGTTNLKVENINTQTTPTQPIATGTNPATINVTFGSQQSTLTYQAPTNATPQTVTVVLFTEIQILISKT